jgi:hypothetical protein
LGVILVNAEPEPFGTSTMIFQVCEGISTGPFGILLPSKLAGPEIMSSSDWAPLN